MMAFSSFWKYCAPLSLLLLVSYSHTGKNYWISLWTLWKFTCQMFY